MHFFGGTFTTGGGESWIPEKTRWSLRQPSAHVWTTGVRDRIQIAEVPSRRRWAVVIGAHGVSESELTGWLRGTSPTAPATWPGSYTVVLGDGPRTSVFADPAHAIPIYYTEVDGIVVWASSSHALSGLSKAGINTDWICALVCDPAGFAPADRSAFDNVSLVPAGHRLELGTAGAPIVRRWWSPPAPIHPRGASDGFRRALGDAVDVRLRMGETVSCDLSGGLDSTSLCLLAASRAQPGQRIIASTVHPRNVDRGGDLDYARAAADGRAGMAHVTIPLADDAAPFTGIEGGPAVDEPAPSTITSVRHRRGYALVAAHGSTMHISGDGGDALLMQGPEHTSRLLRRGRLLRALRDLHGWARINRVGSARLMTDIICSRREDTHPHPWLTLRPAHEARHSSVGNRARTSKSDAELIGLVGIGRTARADVQLAGHVGLRLETPFLDRAVVEAALRFPFTHRGSPWEYKPQITTALVDVLPPAVRRRCAKGGTDADHHQGLRINLTSVLKLADGWLAGHGIIDPRVLRSELRRAASGRPTAWGLIEPVIAAEVWARSVEAGRAPVWFREAERSGVRA
ncbi:albusnodin/ikarugamycin family macrolactam cyclase [Nocardiopsis aegyptia]|uniref:albusnodin/ikarugamycin family macrolactam cyclase n=1 Tax=Nocardiopsis aegyptia TaxID=220378 RepID=UPI0015CC1E05|nr:albusnodin/ikarugamycin family macrolactam cyclase [Nocardiopsis aegyptia]